MEDQEASATMAVVEDNMPDGLEPVSPDSEQVGASENPVDDLGDTISKKNEEAKSYIDSNSTEIATKPKSNDLTAAKESRVDKLPADDEKIQERDSVSAENKSAIENNIDSPPEGVKDSVESALVETVDREKSLDNLESESPEKDSVDAVESEKDSKGSNKTSDNIDSENPTENTETEEEPSDKVECVKDIVNTEDDKTPEVLESVRVSMETLKSVQAVADPKNPDEKEANVEKSEDNLLNSVSDSVSKDDINETGDKLSDSKTVGSNVESADKDDTVEGDSGEGKEKKQNGPEECPDERKPSNKTKKRKDNDKIDSTTAEYATKANTEEKSSAEPEKDNRENPEFESAPETAEMSHTDSQVLDPFDELLKEDSGSKANERNKRRKRRVVVDTESNVDDDTNADDDINDSSHVDEDHTEVPDDSVDESNVADLTEGQGADEEVCLLPDTEREISEADKQRALAAKNTPKEVDSAASAFDSLVADSGDKEDDGIARLGQMKGEMTTDENGENQEGTSAENELNSLHEDIDLGEDDGLPAIDGEKDKEAEESEAAEPPLENLPDNVIQEISQIQETCIQCIESKMCCFRLVVESETKYICSTECTKLFNEVHINYIVVERKVFIKEVGPTEVACIQCGSVTDCFYKISDEADKYICGEICLKAFIGEAKEKHIVSRKKKCVQEIIEKEAACMTCTEIKKCIFEVPIEGELRYLCSPMCVTALQKSTPSIYRVKKRKVLKVKQPMLKLKVISNATDKYLDSGHKMVAKTPEQVASARADRDKSFFRMCAQCSAPYLGNDKNLSWETMDFCNEGCLGKYQNQHGSHCANCKNEVSITSLGKYCVRFGYDIRQFCCSGCLEEFKKGLKICCYCQRDISLGYEGFLAPVGDKGQFKDFCSQFCVEKFDQMSKNPEPPAVWARCAVCSKEKPTQLEVAIDNKSSVRLCSEPCFAAFKFVNHVFPDQCRWCNKYFERKSSESYTIYTEAANHCFCTKACMNVYISNSRHIVPCDWCKVKKYNFDMIKRTLDNGQSMMMCSLNCLTLYQVSVTAMSSRRIKCDQCKRNSQAQYHLTMSDATVRNFCTYQCVMSFQGQYSKTPLVMEGDASSKQAVPTGAPRRTLNSTRSSAKVQVKALEQRSSGMPVISSVQSLATASTPPPLVASVTRSKGKREQRKQQLVPIERDPTPPPPPPPRPITPPPPPPPKIYNHVIIKPAPPKVVKNMSTLAKPIMVTKGITCKPNMVNKECQTEDHLQKRVLIPIPVPIYVPAPMAMYSVPFPIPVPIPFPIPIPVFIPTTRNTASGIMKEIKKIHEKMPTDPFEAELLMMAEMVAGEKKKAESDSESEEDAPALASPADGGFSPDPMDTGNSAFGEDVLQMALKMATEYEEPAVDLESAMTASTITPSSHPNMPTMLHPSAIDDNSPLHHHQLMILEQQRAAVAAAGRKRGSRGGALPPPSPTPAPPLTRAKRARRHEPAPPPQPVHAEPPREPQEKPDANMCLKYTFGVNAWKQWVVTKNQEMEKSSVRRKPFKSEILQLTADELNYSLCLFVKEVRKPNGSEYAPDTIYYLVLGIQQYLFENGRIDNIFTDSYYEKFTECLDEVARKFSVLYNDSQYIVTRVEEEHLWESKQLGAHSPHVLLSTLMFFNTKHFNLVTAEEHMQLSFSHIMKHWKRNPNQPGAAKIPGSRNVLLRFYPPQSALEANSRKKKVYEQQENEENPLRCPVKLYEFYLSKCPESVKTRNDVFYLMPERSCVPDSPVWYSTQALGKEPLSKMLHRVKMVKEINIALLTS